MDCWSCFLYGEKYVHMLGQKAWADPMELVVVYDNEALKEGLKQDWGFACLVGGDILFDTGAKGEILLYNMKKLGIDPTEVKSVVVSHDHWDHTGGLRALLQENERISVYAPSRACRSLREHASPKTEFVPCSGPTRVRGGFVTTGVFSSGVEEQGLVCMGEKKSFLIVGCSHPGVDLLLRAATRIVGSVEGVIGGFHGFNEFEIFKGLSVVSPCHCTKYKKEIEEKFPNEFKRCGAGLQIEF